MTPILDRHGKVVAWIRNQYVYHFSRGHVDKIIIRFTDKISFMFT